MNKEYITNHILFLFILTVKKFELFKERKETVTMHPRTRADTQNIQMRSDSIIF